MINYVIWSAIIIHISISLISIWRTWRGENIIDRLIGFDLTTTLFLAILILIAIVEENNLYIDIAIGLAALSAIGTVALAKFIADQRVF